MLIGCIKLGTGLYNKRQIKGLEELSALSLVGFLFPSIFVVSYAYINTASVSVSYMLSTGGMLGVALFTIFAVAVVVLKQIAKGKQAAEKRNIMRLIYGFLSVVFSAAFLTALTKGFITIESESVNVTFGSSLFLTSMRASIDELSTYSVYACSLISYLIFVALVVFALLWLYSSCADFWAGEKKSCGKMAYAIVLVILSIAYFVLALITMRVCYNADESLSSVSLASGVIVSLVFAVLIFVIAIVEACTLKSKEYKTRKAYYDDYQWRG